MFSCRVCSNSPFAKLFGFSETEEHDKQKRKRKKKARSPKKNSDANSYSGTGSGIESSDGRGKDASGTSSSSLHSGEKRHGRRKSSKHEKGEKTEKERKGEKRDKGGGGKSIATDTTEEDTQGEERRLSPFQSRSAQEVDAVCNAWENYVHPRAKEFWQSSHQLKGILSCIAKGCNKGEDPVLGDDTQCVHWYGDISSSDNLPIIKMTKPGESQESQTYVNRALVFLYADEQSFLELQAKPKKAFTMACGDPRCVNLTHISLDD